MALVYGVSAIEGWFDSAYMHVRDVSLLGEKGWEHEQEDGSSGEGCIWKHDQDDAEDILHRTIARFGGPGYHVDSLDQEEELGSFGKLVQYDA